MLAFRRRGFRRIGVVLIAALVLVPLFLSAHRHLFDPGTGSDSCSVCVATHHSPAVAAPPLPHLSPLLEVLVVAATDVVAVFRIDRPATTGRSPPALRSARFV
jgi:hypothetical protein